MTTKLLLIETDETHKVEVSQQEAPALFEAWDAWIGAEQASSREAHLWNRVLEEAGAYVDDNTTFDGEIIERRAGGAPMMTIQFVIGVLVGACLMGAFVHYRLGKAVV